MPRGRFEHDAGRQRSRQGARHGGETGGAMARPYAPKEYRNPYNREGDDPETLEVHRTGTAAATTMEAPTGASNRRAAADRGDVLRRRGVVSGQPGDESGVPGRTDSERKLSAASLPTDRYSTR